jgi:hypothetical protein
MTLEADLLLEKRRLYEYVFFPDGDRDGGRDEDRDGGKRGGSGT